MSSRTVIKITAIKTVIPDSNPIMVLIDAPFMIGLIACPTLIVAVMEDARAILNAIIRHTFCFFITHSLFVSIA